MKNQQKIALVTGGSRGLGKNMAVALAKRGIDAVITYNANAKAADEVVNEIHSLRRKAKAFQLDTTLTNTFDRFLADVTGWLSNEYGHAKFDFLINNAGTALYSAIADVTDDQLNQVFDIHYKDYFLLTQKAL